MSKNSSRIGFMRRFCPRVLDTIQKSGVLSPIILKSENPSFRDQGINGYHTWNMV
jgi:hypothetical protein